MKKMVNNAAPTVFTTRYLPLMSAGLVLVSLIIFMEYSGWKGKHEAGISALLNDQEKLPRYLEGKGRQIFFFDQEFRVNQNAPYSPGLAAKFSILTPGDSSWLRITGQIRFNEPSDSLKCSLVATCNHRGINYKYSSLNLASMKLSQDSLHTLTLDYQIPRCVDSADFIQVYFWNWGAKEVVVKNLGVTLF